jgi:hypothetical protein
MANAERPEELHALAIAERVLGIKLVHTDSSGQVDIQSVGSAGNLDGKVAIEVTTVTEQDRIATLKRFRRTLDKERTAEAQDNLGPAILESCWIIIAPDTQHGAHKLGQQAEKQLSVLEKNEVTRFHPQRDVVAVRDHDPASDELRRARIALARLGIQIAQAVSDHARETGPEGGPHRHRVVTSLGSGGSASGSNESVELVCAELDDRADNPKKLRASGAERQHLFVWVNEHTSFGIARPLSRNEPEWVADDQFGLPTAPPDLDDTVTDLWVVHSGSLRGWYWDSEAWRALQEPVTSRPENH